MIALPTKTFVLLPAIALAMAALVAAPRTAGAARPGAKPDGEPPFMRFLYPPELVMKNARAISLRPDQRQAITEAIQETQAATVDLGWSMQEAATDLARAIEGPRIDEPTALEAAERVMTIEAQIKRAHLALVIRIKNVLDPAQQAELARLRDETD